MDPRAEVPGASITGVILDASGHNVPNATVKLLRDGHLFDIPENPQQSNNVADPYVSVGRYQFNRLSYGQYMVVASIPDAAGNVHETNLSVDMNANTVTADLVIPDLVINPPVTPCPSPAVSPSATPASPDSLALAPLGLGMCLLIIAHRKHI